LGRYAHRFEQALRGHTAVSLDMPNGMECPFRQRHLHLVEKACLQARRGNGAGDGGRTEACLDSGADGLVARQFHGKLDALQ